MLEHAALQLDPWTPTTLSGETAWIRPIAIPLGLRLGFVRLVGAPETSWFAWLRRLRLEVFETDDASHLMTLTRSWGMLRSWDVHDAEDRHVGRVYPRTLVTSEYQRLGFIDVESSEKGRILDPQGEPLATYADVGAGRMELAFLPQPSANPFLRMMLLGSVLTLHPVPRRALAGR